MLKHKEENFHIKILFMLLSGPKRKTDILASFHPDWVEWSEEKKRKVWVCERCKKKFQRQISKNISCKGIHSETDKVGVTNLTHKVKAQYITEKHSSYPIIPKPPKDKNAKSWIASTSKIFRSLKQNRLIRIIKRGQLPMFIDGTYMPQGEYFILNYDKILDILFFQNGFGQYEIHERNHSTKEMENEKLWYELKCIVAEHLSRKETHAAFRNIKFDNSTPFLGFLNYILLISILNYREKILLKKTINPESEEFRPKLTGIFNRLSYNDLKDNENLNKYQKRLAQISFFKLEINNIIHFFGHDNPFFKAIEQSITDSPMVSKEVCDTLASLFMRRFPLSGHSKTSEFYEMIEIGVPLKSMIINDDRLSMTDAFALSKSITKEFERLLKLHFEKDYKYHNVKGGHYTTY